MCPAEFRDRKLTDDPHRLKVTKTVTRRAIEQNRADVPLGGELNLSRIALISWPCGIIQTEPAYVPEALDRYDQLAKAK